MITFIVVSLAVMAIHCCVWFEQKSQLCGTFRGGSILQLLYLDVYAEYDNKISCIMLSHDYQLACEISTVRTLTVKAKKTHDFNLNVF